MKSKFKKFLREFWFFGLKQAWACLFGGFFLAVIIFSTLIDFDGFFLSRYDFLFFAAILIQVGMLFFKLETKNEAKVILIFHIVGTVMEIFKTSSEIGSWSYPEESFFRIGNVPLFSGFMYSAVGSYLARAWKSFDLKFKNYPQLWLTILLSVFIYLNFFIHHYFWDFRYFLFAFVVLMYWKTWVYFQVEKTYRRMPMLLGFFLIAFFIWIAENIGTFTKVWIYPNQKYSWELVNFNKLGSWFLLMIISFVLVSLVNQKSLKETLK